MKWFAESHKLVLPKSEGRATGLHISEVIRDYAVKASVLDKKWVTEISLEEQNTNLMQVGLGWEDYLAKYQHPEIEFHPGQLYMEDQEFCECTHDRDVHTNLKHYCTVDGCLCGKFRPLRIYGSPDGISIIDPEDYADLFVCSHNFCHEFKFTKKSSRDFLELLNQRSPKTLMWQWQIMCYCKMMDTLAAKLHVMFINGDYSPGFAPPDYLVFRAEYTHEDIDGNWDKFQQHARHMMIERLAA